MPRVSLRSDLLLPVAGDVLADWGLACSDDGE